MGQEVEGNIWELILLLDQETKVSISFFKLTKKEDYNMLNTVF